MTRAGETPADEPPVGFTHADVPFEAHGIRVERGDSSIDEEHLADALERLVARSRGSLSGTVPRRSRTAGDREDHVPETR
jgi:hypothetical protein